MVLAIAVSDGQATAVSDDHPGTGGEDGGVGLLQALRVARDNRTYCTRLGPKLESARPSVTAQRFIITKDLLPPPPNRPDRVKTPFLVGQQAEATVTKRKLPTYRIGHRPLIVP